MYYLDTSTVALSLAEKVANLRIFDDDRGKMKRSPLDVKGSALVGSYAFPYWTNQIST
jgi:D-aminoacyl-tRNA deacylase